MEGLRAVAERTTHDDTLRVPTTGNTQPAAMSMTNGTLQWSNTAAPVDSLGTTLLGSIVRLQPRGSPTIRN